MEKRLAYTQGFDIATPAGGRDPAYDGGHFSTSASVPALLRGPAGGFVASVLVRPLTSESYFGVTPPENQFVAGSFDFTALEGYAFVMDGASALNVMVGDASAAVDLEAETDNFVTLVVTPAGNFSVFHNGRQVVAPTALTYATGPNNFGIGGTVDPSYVTALGTEAWGAISAGIGGFMVSSPPDLSSLPAHIFENSAARLFASVQEALDTVDGLPDPLLNNGGVFPPSAHIFSTRRGVPNLGDNDNPWPDEVGSVSLERVGDAINASVFSREGGGNWAVADVPGPSPAPLVIVSTGVSTTTAALGVAGVYQATATGITITVSSADITEGREFVFKDRDGLASVGTPITIATEGGELIDGAATALITVPFGSVNVYADAGDLLSK